MIIYFINMIMNYANYTGTKTKTKTAESNCSYIIKQICRNFQQFYGSIKSRKF